MHTHQFSVSQSLFQGHIKQQQQGPTRGRQKNMQRQRERAMEKEGGIADAKRNSQETGDELQK